MTRYLRLFLLLLACAAPAACAGSPAKTQESAVDTPPAGADSVSGDYQDCYSKACLERHTPELQTPVWKSVRACMQERGHGSGNCLTGW